MTTIVEDVEQQKVRKEPVKKGCPYWMGLIPCTLLLVADVLACYFFVDRQKAEWYFPIFAYVYGGLCLGWWLFLTVYRIVTYGSCGFYDIYWFCNMGLLLTGIGCFLRLPTLLGQSMCLLFFPHSTFWLDCGLYPCFHKGITNTYSYMFDKAIPIFEKITSLHHVWYFPGILLVIWKQPLLSIWSYVFSILLFIALITKGYYLTPLEAPTKEGTMRYLNVCLAHEYPTFVRNIPPFKWTIGKPFFFHCLCITVSYIIPVNFITYLIIIGIQKLILLSSVSCENASCQQTTVFHINKPITI